MNIGEWYAGHALHPRKQLRRWAPLRGGAQAYRLVFGRRREGGGILNFYWATRGRLQCFSCCCATSLGTLRRRTCPTDRGNGPSLWASAMKMSEGWADTGSRRNLVAKPLLPAGCPGCGCGTHASRWPASRPHVLVVLVVLVLISCSASQVPPKLWPRCARRPQYARLLAPHAMRTWKERHACMRSLHGA